MLVHRHSAARQGFGSRGNVLPLREAGTQFFYSMRVVVADLGVAVPSTRATGAPSTANETRIPRQACEACGCRSTSSATFGTPYR